MSTTPRQKCVLALQQKAALSGRKISTEEAMRQCSKKFPVRFKKIKKGK
jgi:hypothetical protein